MAAPRTHPALFHRVFFGHLLMLLVCFVSGIILLDYLFVSGLSLYLQRTPLILIPAMLALIGLAGLTALWTSGSSSLPLDKVSTLLNADANAEEIAQLLATARTEENATLIRSLQARLTRIEQSADRRALFLLIDSHLNILSTDTATAARLGHTPAEIANSNLRAFLAVSPGDLHALLSLLAAGTPPQQDLPLRLHASENRTVRAMMSMHPIGDDRWLLLGNDVRRG
jgi:hypothetical protein